MCYSSIYDREWKKLKNIFVNLEDVPEESGKRFFPKSETYVVAQSKKRNVPIVKNMAFGLRPSWATHGKFVSSPPYNARLDRMEESGLCKKIYEVQPWKSYFGKHHCLIPITSFYEICRDKNGSAFNHEVRFDLLQENLFWAGLYSWHKDDEGLKTTFAGITRDPFPKVAAAGHTRSPLLLEPEAAIRWLGEFASPHEAFDHLEKSGTVPSGIDFTKIRELKSP